MIGIYLREVKHMFASSVDHHKRDLIYFDGMLLVYGHGVRSRTGYVKFCDDGELRYVSSFPLYRVFVHSILDDVEYYRSCSNYDNFYGHRCRCFKSLFGFGDYDGEGVPLRHRKHDVYFRVISSYSWWYDLVSWVKALSKLEQCIKKLSEFLS